MTRKSSPELQPGKIGNRLLLAASLMLSFALAEFACRLILPPPNFVPVDVFSADHLPGLLVAHSERGFTYQRNFVGQLHNSDFDIRIETNSIGLRELPIQSFAEEGTRVLAIGDSFTEGFGVEYAEAWPRKLQSILNDSAKTKVDRVRVINAGIDGYGMRQMRQLTEELVAQFDPDSIIVGVYVHGHSRVNNPFVLFNGYLVRQDMVDRSILTSEGFYYADATSPTIVAIELWLARYSYLGMYSIKVLRKASVRVEGLLFDQKENLDLALKLEPMLRELQRIAELGDASNIPVTAFLISGQNSAGHFSDDVLQSHDVVLEFCETEGIDVIDSLPDLMSASKEGAILRFDNDGHWNVTAHSIAAHTLAKHLNKRMLGVPSQSGE